MKDTAKKFIISILATLYLLAASISVCSIQQPEANTIKSEKQVQFSKKASKFSIHAPVETKLHDAQAKKAFTPLIDILNSNFIACFVPYSFSQYILYYKNFLVRFSSTDIIYPFHYFW